MNTARTFAAGIFLCIGCVGGLAQTPTTPGAHPAPKEAGARYGQALGVALVCYGLRTQQAALKALHDSYPDAKDQKQFQAAADQVLDSWQAMNTCKNAGGPNSCMLSHIWSCRDALAEIGPQGSKLPGLIESMQ